MLNNSIKTIPFMILVGLLSYIIILSHSNKSLEIKVRDYSNQLTETSRINNKLNTEIYNIKTIHEKTVNFYEKRLVLEKEICGIDIKISEIEIMVREQFIKITEKYQMIRDFINKRQELIDTVDNLETSFNCVDENTD